MPFGIEARVADVVGLGRVEDEIDRIESDDRGQQGRAGLPAGDQIAGIDPAVGDAAGDRRAHLGPFQVELRGVQRGLGRQQLRARDVEVGLALVEFAHRRRGGLHQFLGALVVGDVQHDLRLGAHHVGLGGVDGELERPLVDGEQQIALLDDARRRGNAPRSM